MTRRSFLATTSFSPFAAVATSANPQRLPIRKAVLLNMLPRDLSYEERFRLAREVGFEQIECPTIKDPAEAEAIKEASLKAGLPIHSVMNSDHWKFPLSSPDPNVVEQSLQCMRTSLENARLWGADTVLLVPAVVNENIRYVDAWNRSQKHIRTLLPLAEKLRVVIAVENVWNKFLLSPLEFARYVDEFQSPWLKAYFDVGNVVLFGYPQDWIRTLGNRIVKLHFKDFRFRRAPGSGGRLAEFVPLREGDINWKEVYQALREIGYRGTATVEVEGGGREVLAEISRRVDLILEGA